MNYVLYVPNLCRECMTNLKTLISLVALSQVPTPKTRLSRTVSKHHLSAATDHRPVIQPCWVMGYYSALWSCSSLGCSCVSHSSSIRASASSMSVWCGLLCGGVVGVKCEASKLVPRSGMYLWSLREWNIPGMAVPCNVDRE